MTTKEQNLQLLRDAKAAYEELGLYDSEGFVKGKTHVVVDSCEAHDSELVACTEGVNCPTASSIDPAEGPFSDRPWVKLRELKDNTLRRCVPKKLIPLFEIANLEARDRPPQGKTWIEKALGPATGVQAQIARATKATDRAGRVYAALRARTPTTCESIKSRSQCYAVREKGHDRASPTGFHQKCFWTNDARVLNNDDMDDVAESQQCAALRPIFERYDNYFTHVLSSEDADEMEQGSFRTILDPLGKYTYDPGLQMYRPKKVTRIKMAPDRVTLLNTVDADDDPVDLTNMILPAKVPRESGNKPPRLEKRDTDFVVLREHPRNRRVVNESLRAIFQDH